MGETYHDPELPDVYPTIPAHLMEPSDKVLTVEDQALLHSWMPGNPVTAYWGTGSRETVETIQLQMIAERKAAIRLGVVGLDVIPDTLLRHLEAQKLLRARERLASAVADIVRPSYLDD